MTIDRDEVLDRWARKEATAAIAGALGLEGRAALKQILNIVDYARRQGDERAGFKIGRESKGRPVKPPHANRGPTRRQRLEAALRAGEPMPGWHFGVTSIEVTWLGLGSRDCQRIPISVSCVPRRAPVTQLIRSKTRRTIDGHKTFADAFAGRSALQDAGVAGGSDRAAGSSQTQAAPEKS